MKLDKANFIKVMQQINYLSYSAERLPKLAKLSPDTGSHGGFCPGPHATTGLENIEGRGF